MSPLLLVLLSVSIIALWIGTEDSREIHRILRGATLLVGLVWIVAIAPWYLKLVMILALMNLERFYPLNSKDPRTSP
jgi:hypothetical protein